MASNEKRAIKSSFLSNFKQGKLSLVLISAIPAIAVLFLSIILYWYWMYGCDQTEEHTDMTCSIINGLYLIPNLVRFQVIIAQILSHLGLMEFKCGLRYMLDKLDRNNSESVPAVFNLPVLVEDWNVSGIIAHTYTPYQLIGKKNQPVMFYFHGGGGIMLSPSISDLTLRYLADSLKVRIVAPNYHKSPEVLFPQPQEDCLSVAIHFLKRSEEYGIDKTRVIVSGDSFGGHVALYVAFKWTEMGLNKRFSPLRALIPIYPRVQWVNLQLDSYLAYKNDGRMSSVNLISTYISLALSGDCDLVPWISNHSIVKFSRHYQERRARFPELFPDLDWEPPNHLTAKYSSYADTLLSPFATLLFQPDFSILPPTLIIGAEYDMLLSEGLLLKSRLEESGVSVEYYEGEKMFHGFFHINPLNLTSSYEANNRLTLFVKKYI